MNERILIFSVAPLWTPHFETELDLAMVHKSQGDTVRLAVCGGFLATCLANPAKLTDICILCRSRCRAGLSLAGLTRDEWGWMEPAPSTGVQIPEFDSLGDLRAYHYRGVPVGNAAASTLVSTVRDSNPDLSVWSFRVNALVRSGIDAYEAATRELDRFRPDLVYVFNGRNASQAPLVAACVAKGVRFLVHESGGELGSFRLVDALSVHSIDWAKRAIAETWELAAHDTADREGRAHRFFTSRRLGTEAGLPERFDYTKRQSRGLLPKGVDISNSVVIFNSSEDEFVALGEYQNPIYPDQMHALDAILADVRLSEIQFVLRAHPNLAALDNTQTRHIASLGKYPNLMVIDPEEPIDTYAMMESCRMVLTFGSTTGIEAVYWGTPSVLVGRAPYEDLGCITPTSHEELVEMLLGPRPPTPDRQIALKYGLHAGGGNARLRFVEQLEYGRVLVGHRELRATRLAKWLANSIWLLRRLRSGEESRWGIVAGALARLPSTVPREFRR